MKRYKYILFLFLMCTIHTLRAQEKPYNSMIFRSQIFDSSHQPVKNENLKVEVDLFTKDKVWYSENQQINTNTEGFVFIQVGKGSSIIGNFKDVPFDNQEISLRIKYKVLNSNGTSTGDYVQLQSTDLYAVPYAFHALTAESVTGKSTNNPVGSSDPDPSSGDTSGSKGNTWSVYGNKYIGMRNGFLGTVDSSPLNFKTNNQTRINITPEGKINFLGDINIGNANTVTIANLITDHITTNTATINNLTAQTGVIESTVQSTNPDIGALIVKGGTGIKKNLNVGENLTVYSNTNLLGNLQTTGNSKFLDKADFDKQVKINDLTESGALNEGSFVTAGGASVAKNLNIGGNTNITGNLKASQNVEVGQNLKIIGSENATNKDHGAVIIEAGGLGVEKDIVTGGNIKSNANLIADNNLEVANIANLNTLNVAGNSITHGITQILNNTFSTNPTQGALVVQGGVGIGENLNVAQNATINGVLTANNLAVNSTLQINGTAEAVDQNSGALIVTEGGLGVEKSIYSGKNITAVQHITANGNLNSLQNTSVGQNLSVVANTTTNSLNVSNAANLGGITTITNATHSTNSATGALVVAGGLGVNENVNIGQNLSAGGNLNVAQNANITGTLTANNLALNNMLQINGTAEAVDQNSGALIVAEGGLGVEKSIYSGKNITAVQHITANGNLNSLQNTTVGQNLSVAANTTTNSLNVSNATNLGGITTITNATHSTNSSTGALIVAGGLGVNENINIGQDLNVTKDTNLNGNLYTNKLSTFNDNATFNKQLEIKSSLDDDNSKALKVDGGIISGKRVHIKSTLNQPYGDFTNAALKVDGGAIVNGNLSVLGQVFAQNATVNTLTPLSVDTFTYYNNPYQRPLLNNKGFGPDNVFDSYTLKVNAVDQGIAIKVNKHAPSNNGVHPENSPFATSGNNFISFWDNTGRMVGRVEAQTEAEVQNSTEYQRQLEEIGWLAKDIAYSNAIKGIKMDFKDIKEKMEAAKTKQTEGAGAQVSFAIPENVISTTLVQGLSEENVQLTREIIKQGDEIALMAEDIVKKGEEFVRAQEKAQGMLDSWGVTYSSHAGDYAEYLELINLGDKDKIIPSTVVGVTGGKISFNTENCEKIMVVSKNPAVVGKLPEDNVKNKFKPVAFMGQVPVYVLNKAKIGDYIIPSGNNDGYAVAKSGDNMTINDYKKIIGIAWEETNASKVINVVVGINTNDVVGIIKKQQNQIETLESRISKIEKYLSQNSDAAFTSQAVKDTIKDDNDDLILSAISKDYTINDNVQKIVKKVIENLKTKNIDSLKNKNMYIENEVNNYFGGIFFAKDFNDKLTSEEQKLFTQYFKVIVGQIKMKLL